MCYPPELKKWHDPCFALNERLSDPAQGVLGRFISRDPIGHAGGLNLYTYAYQNSVTLTDHTGLRPPMTNTQVTNQTKYPGEYARIPDEYSRPQDYTVELNFVAGYGDSMSFGASELCREWMGTDHLIDTESDAHFKGEIASLIGGFLRLAYAGVIKGIPSLAKHLFPKDANKAARFAVNARTTCKIGFRGFLFPVGGRLYSYEQMLQKYGSAHLVIAAAGRSGKFENAYGIWATSAGVVSVSGNYASHSSKD